MWGGTCGAPACAALLPLAPTPTPARDTARPALRLPPGPALVLDVTAAGSNISARLLEGLAPPRGVERLIFKTDNTQK